MRKRPLGKTQKRILEILHRLKNEERSEWVSTHILIIMTYNPHQLDSKNPNYKGYKDYSYNQNEFIATHRAISALERRGLVQTKKIKLKDAMPERGKVFGGVQVRRMVKLVGD